MSFFKKLFGRGKDKEKKETKQEQNIVESAKEKIEDAVAPIEEKTVEIKEQITEKVENLQEQATEKVESFKEKASNVVEPIKENVSEVKEGLTENVGAVKDKISEKVEDIQEQATEKVESFKEKAAELKESVVSKVDEVKTQVNEKTDTLKGVVEEKVIEQSPVVPTPVPPPPPTNQENQAQKIQEDLDKGLEKTKRGFFSRISRAVAGKSTVDVEVLDELEAALIASDVGLDTTIKIIERIEARVARDKYINTTELNEIMRDEIVQLLAENNTTDVTSFSIPQGKVPYVILVVGVNGVGKTTTIGKVAYQYMLQGKKVVLGAADTFRAAAVDQLEIWSNRVGCDFYSKGMNTDPAAVAYETVQYAMNNGMDVCIIDTAGRLHTKTGLMNELSKIYRSIDKKMPGAPHDVLLVLDATTGQNAIEQCTHFSKATNVTALALTKLDGTAKGGVAIGISDQFKIPIKYLGVGEEIHKLQIFNKRAFVDSLFKDIES